MLRLEAKGSPGKFHTILLVLELSPELEVASRESEASVAPGASAAYQHREPLRYALDRNQYKYIDGTRNIRAL